MADLSAHGGSPKIGTTSATRNSPTSSARTECPELAAALGAGFDLAERRVVPRQVARNLDAGFCECVPHGAELHACAVAIADGTTPRE